MFLSTLHSVGTLVSDEIPVPSPPRHCDQFEPGAAVVENCLNAANASRLRAKAENSRVDTRLIISSSCLDNAQDQITVRQAGFRRNVDLSKLEFRDQFRFLELSGVRIKSHLTLLIDDDHSSFETTANRS
jgi:hypothetical protein